MESSGGKIVAESAGEGRGSTFILSLPLEIANEETNIETRESGAFASTGREYYRRDAGDQDVSELEMSKRYNIIEE